jgi:hypothetical protein
VTSKTRDKRLHIASGFAVKASFFSGAQQATGNYFARVGHQGNSQITHIIKQ